MIPRRAAIGVWENVRECKFLKLQMRKKKKNVVSRNVWSTELTAAEKKILIESENLEKMRERSIKILDG